MPQIVNFDVVTCDIVEVKKTIGGRERVWYLRDDVSTEVLIRFFELARAQDETVRAAQAAGNGVEASFHAVDGVYMRVLLDIFRHTYPETDEEELRQAFTFQERKRLVDLFFSLAGIAWSEPSSAAPDATLNPASLPPGPPPSVEEPTTLIAGENRAARRARTRAKTTPSAAAGVTAMR